MRQGSRTSLVGQLTSLVMATMTSQAMLVVLAPTLVAVSRSFEVEVSSVGQARSIAAGVAVLSAALVPRLLSRWGLRRLLVIGVAWAGLGSVTAAAAPSLPVYLAAHALVGVAIGTLLSVGFAGVAAFPERDRSWAMGYVASANALAWVVANPIIGALTEALSWRAGQLVPIGFAAAALATAHMAPSLAQTPLPSGALRLVATTRGARRWAAAELLAYCAWAGALLTFIGAYFIERHGVGESLVGVLLAAGAAAYVFSSVRGGALAYRIRRRRLVLGPALAMCVLFAALFALDAHLWISFSLFCAIALLAGVRTPASAGLGMAQLPTHPGVMMAARTGTTQLGYLVGALSAGAVLAVADYKTLGFVLSAVMLASLALMWRVREPGGDARER
jgi:predicted MFS family arabinose efflux permease